MEQLTIIKTLAELESLRIYLEDKDFLAYDTETTGNDVDCQIIGFSVCADVEAAYYVVLSYWDVEKKQLVDLETKAGAKSFIANLKRHSLLMHNAPSDCMWTMNNFGVDLMPYVHTDTLLLAHLLDENRRNGLKELGISIFGQDAAKEQQEMKASVTKNGGVLTKDNYELYKADADLIARYGAKDGILTLKLFYHMVPQLYEEGLDKFFYEEESMPLLRGPTYDLNSIGLKIDTVKLQELRGQLEAECFEAKAFIYKEIKPYIQDEYPGTSKKNVFNIDAPRQMSWLLFYKLKNYFGTLTDSGREVCRHLGLKLPYTNAAKRDFVESCVAHKGEIYVPAGKNLKTGKTTRPKKIGNPWEYMQANKLALIKLADKYGWVKKLLEYKKAEKLLTTYVEGIQTRMKYGVIHPAFKQFGTTSGRYSSSNPNFQNLPRDDKRVKACIIARPGKVFVGADYSQLEPRIFASFSQDKRLLECFRTGDDFYSVIGVEIFDKSECSIRKDDDNSFAKKYPDLRTITKSNVALAATYGTTAAQMSRGTGKTMDECQEIIDSYFERFPSVRQFMLQSHEEAKNNGRVLNLFGRPRRMPEARVIKQHYDKIAHGELPYELRNILNLAVNHKVQATAASIMNRAAIRAKNMCLQLALEDAAWNEVKVVMQIHDELVLEGPEALAEDMAVVLKIAMEETVEIPDVALIAEPKISKDIANLK